MIVAVVVAVETVQTVDSIVAILGGNAIIIATLAWHLSARLTKIESRLAHLERVASVYEHQQKRSN